MKTQPAIEIAVQIQRLRTNRSLARDINYTEIVKHYQFLDDGDKKNNLLTLLFLLASTGMFSPEESLTYINNIHQGVLPSLDEFLQLTDLSYRIVEDHLVEIHSPKGLLN